MRNPLEQQVTCMTAIHDVAPFDRFVETCSYDCEVVNPLQRYVRSNLRRVRERLVEVLVLDTIVPPRLG